MVKKRVGLLSSFGNLYLVPILKELIATGTMPAAIILDGAQTAASQEIVRARMLPAQNYEHLTDVDLPQVPCFFVKDHNAASTLELVRKLGLDYLANAGTPRIIKEALIHTVSGIFNCHPGLLPNYKGCTCLEWSIFNGDPVAATVHFMTPGIDDGPVLYSEIMSVKPFEDYKQIRTRMMSHQAKVLAKSIKQALAQGQTLKAMPKPKEPGTYYKPIPEDKLSIVMRKLEKGEFQCGS